jgi:uncharacterized membrane protein YhaH (DUF805 family)
MFKNPFSFKGRIRRTEYGLSYIISMVLIAFMNFLSTPSIVSSIGFFVFLVLAIWFLFAQGAKRCHDLGNSGWWQLIPFMVFGCCLLKEIYLRIDTEKIHIS